MKSHRAATGVKRQPACKPGSVWPRALRHGTWRPFILGAGCPAPHATYPDSGLKTAPEGFPSPRPYSVLLPVRFTMPLPLPVARWALTPPFHPYPANKSARLCDIRSGRFVGWAVCFLWHFPWGCPRRPLAGTVSSWSPDFPHAPPFGIDACGRPASWQPQLGWHAAESKGKARRPEPADHCAWIAYAPAMCSFTLAQ